VVWHGLTRSQLFLVPSTLLLTVWFLRRRQPELPLAEAVET